MDQVGLSTLAVFALIVTVSLLVHGAPGMGFPALATPLLALFGVRSAILFTRLLLARYVVEGLDAPSGDAATPSTR